eukprot:TRINITY_DN2141_c0_g4_i9.p1 TRINITY_DN2141_c0_g4~~TRINITY_DN2141_c0_g4_i9.p1  ORF type:complete len:896 (+),score=169.69 TRINITY_DN2141_c0_g4_i9:52-2739(+)
MEAILEDWDSGRVASEGADALKGTPKSNEELQKFAMKEDLGDLELNLALLDAPHIIQRTVGIQMIPRVFRAYHRQIVDRVFPRVLKEASLLTLESSLQKFLAESLLQCIDANLLTKQQVYEIFFPPIMCILQGRSDEDVTNSWTSLFLSSIKYLPQDALSDKVLDFTLSRVGQSSLPSARMVGCRLLGGIVPHLDASIITSKILPKVSMLCQDTDYDVRGCMCRQLVTIATSIGPAATKEKILPEVQELAKDEELSVRQASYECLMQLSGFLDKEVVRLDIIPYFKVLCQNPPEDMMVLISRLFGELVHRISGDFEDEDEAMIFYNFFKILAKRPDAECRRNCAFNFPAVVKCINPRRYAMNLHDTYHQLSRDSFVIVRKSVAAGFHEVASIIGKERSVKYLKDIFIGILKDDSIEVKLAIVEHLEQILSMFAVSNEEQKAANYADLLNHLLDFQASIYRNWRCLNTFTTQLVDIPEYFSNDQVYDNFVPLMFKYMEDAACPTREVACRNICHYLRKNKRNYQRTNIIAQIIQKFGKRRCYTNRLLFIDMCQHLLQMFSRRFFRDNFFDTALDLAKDPVSNVRWKFCRLLHTFKRLASALRDEVALKRVEEAIEILLKDKDKDVSEMAKTCQSQMLQESGNARPESPNTDLVDKKKEEEEKAIMAMEQTEIEEMRRRENEIGERGKDHRRKYSESDCVSPLLTMQAPKSKFFLTKPGTKPSSAPPIRPSLSGSAQLATASTVDAQEFKSGTAPRISYNPTTKRSSLVPQTSPSVGSIGPPSSFVSAVPAAPVASQLAQTANTNLASLSYSYRGGRQGPAAGRGIREDPVVQAPSTAKIVPLRKADTPGKALSPLTGSLPNVLTNPGRGGSTKSPMIKPERPTYDPANRGESSACM